MPVARSGCEPCRLRKVKCDFKDKSTGCSNCIKRHLHCPGPSQAVTGARKQRRGKIIDQVELEYGNTSTSQAQTPAITEIVTIDNAPSTELVWYSPSMLSSSCNLLPSITEEMIVTTPAERNLWDVELRSEVAASMLQSFMASHGNLWLSLYPREMVFRAFDIGRNLDDIQPATEAAMRVFMALGARTTMHPAILAGADLTSPLTLGIIREGPCKHLAAIAIERFESLGLWRQPTAEVIKVAVSVVLIGRTALSPEAWRPLVGMLVHLFRQFLDASPLPPDDMAKFTFHFGSMIMLADARCAAETGTRPLFTRDDLADNPMIDSWLNQPLPEVKYDAEPEVLFPVLVRVLRQFASDFHLPLRKGSRRCLDVLPRLYDMQAGLARYTTASMEACAREYATAQTDQATSTDQSSDQRFSAKATAGRRFVSALQINASVIFIVLFTHDLLNQTVTKVSKAVGGQAGADSEVEAWHIAALTARYKARAELKRVAAHVKLVHSVSEGQVAWQHMTRLFYTFETAPGWTALLSPDPSGMEQLSEEEVQLILDGAQEAGWGWGSGPSVWLEAILARG